MPSALESTQIRSSASIEPNWIMQWLIENLTDSRLLSHLSSTQEWEFLKRIFINFERVTCVTRFWVIQIYRFIRGFVWNPACRLRDIYFLKLKTFKIKILRNSKLAAYAKFSVLKITRYTVIFREIQIDTSRNPRKLNPRLKNRLHGI